MVRVLIGTTIADKTRPEIRGEVIASNRSYFTIRSGSRIKPENASYPAVVDRLLKAKNDPPPEVARKPSVAEVAERMGWSEHYTMRMAKMSGYEPHELLED